MSLSLTNQTMAFARTANPGISAKQPDSWSVAQKGSLLEVGFGGGLDFPQYAALHTNTGFLRLNYGPGSGWGTSIILVPSFWEAGLYHQGTQISVAWRMEMRDLVMPFSGLISNLWVFGEVRFKPPKTHLISCIVAVGVDGRVELDRRAGEAYKPVALSSMHISADRWDAKSVQIHSKSFEITENGWIVQPPIVGNRFALKGGSSAWKRHAPTLEIVLNTSLEITGWRTDSSNPDDDNIALWAATDRVLRSWQYTVIATAADDFTAEL
jgi:hypothetical protein